MILTRAKLAWLLRCLDDALVESTEGHGHWCTALHIDPERQVDDAAHAHGRAYLGIDVNTEDIRCTECPNAS